MALILAPVNRIHQYANQIKLLGEKLMGKAQIPMTEQQWMHSEIQRLKKEIELLEKRTR